MGNIKINLFEPEDLYMFKELIDEIENSKINNINLNAKNIAKQIASFCLSEKLIPFIFGEIKLKEHLFFPIAMYEVEEKYLSLKIIFHLLEELTNEKFEDILEEIIKQYKSQPNNLKKIHEKYVNDNKDLIKNYIKTETETHQEALKNIYSCIFSENISLLDFFFKLYSLIFYIEFKSIYKTIPKGSNKINDLFYEIYLSLNNVGDINLIFDIVNQENSLKYKSCQIFLFFLNIFKNEKEITLRDKIDKKLFENFGDIFDINDKLLWTLYKEDINQMKSDKKYIKIILEGKKTEKEKYNFDVFDCIDKIKDNNNSLEYMTGEIFKSIFNKKNVLIINIDLEYIKKNKQSIEQIQDKIKLIQKFCPSEYNNLDIYIQLENNIININSSYDLFIQELRKKIGEEDAKIYLEKNKVNDSKPQKEEEKITNIQNINEKEKNNSLIDKEELEELKIQLNKEKEKNKKLEKELIEEKNKNKISENIISDLRKDLEKEMKKYNELKKEIEKDKTSKEILGKEKKESMIETIIEKDKEIKELKLKLSRSPFTLEEGENLMIITFISYEQQLHYSVMCKNTDEFHKVEGLLYKDNPQFKENENYFLLNGQKINKYKTLEQNGVKNNSQILLFGIDN